MNTISVPILPTGLWLLSTASGISLVIVFFFLYWYMRKRFVSAQGDLRDINELAAQKDQLQAEIKVNHQAIASYKEELLRLGSEREEQERLRSDLTRLQTECASIEQNMIDKRNETGELESQRHTLNQTVESLNAAAGALRAEIADLEQARSTFSDLLSQMAEAERALQAAREQKDVALREVADTAGRLTELRLALDSVQRQVTSLELQRQNLEQTINVKTAEADEARQRAQESAKKLIEIEEELQKKRSAWEHLDERYHGLESGIRSLDADRAALERKIETLQAQIGELEDQQTLFQDLQEQISNAERGLEVTKEKLEAMLQESSSIARQISEQRRDLGDLRQEHASLKDRHRALVEAISRSTVETTDAQKRAQAYTQKAAELEKELQRKRTALEQAEAQHHQLDTKTRRLEAERAGLVKECEELSTKLKGHGQGPGEDPYADLLKPPPCLDKSVFNADRLNWTSEEEAVDNVIQGLSRIGYRFDDRVVKAFHTSLKCHDINPLTVLAGVSGTGKTLLPMAYSRLMGMHSLVMAVQPRWDSPQDMFGFYNYLERCYKATDLARSLLRMDQYNTPDGLKASDKLPERMLLVLLDEMNLARTEYYFSEFLSKLELRRDIANPRIPENRIHAEIVLDTGPGRDDLRLWVDSNIIFVGTMNEDESTQTLSDKVLDRANVLRFGRPRDISMPKANVEDLIAQGYLPAEQWRKWFRKIESRPWTDTVTQWITRLNDALNRIGRPFGYRVQKNILTYVMNYPGFEAPSSYKQAFADQIEQKVLPKLRGIEVLEGAANSALDEIEEIIAQTGDELLLKAFTDTKQEAASGMFLWRGVTR